MALDALGLGGDPGDVEGVGVPPQGERAAGTQDAQGLGDRAGRVGPVPGLGAGEEVGAGVGEGQGVAVAADDGDVRVRPAELDGHAVAGFHGDDVGAAGVQQRGGDARTGADVHDPRPGERAAGEFLDGVQEGGWVGGAVGGVLGRCGVEGVGAAGVEGGCRHGAMVDGGWGVGRWDLSKRGPAGRAVQEWRRFFDGLPERRLVRFSYC